MVEQLGKTDSIFWSAMGISNPVERSTYLDKACAHDSHLRVQLDELLAAYPKVERFLETPACGNDATLINDEAAIAERAGTAIGPYKLLEQIGEGGMGVVFMAEQAKPIQRIVAIKIIKPGMDTRQVIARFEAERQVLAMMDHPNIARVLDAGTTDTGRPYFVMDLVKGVPITDYCDQQHLSIRQRLGLMTQVCQAVQHAHQKGIIHRDLKPSNVLVAEYDGEPVPKIIDFGVAKAIAHKLTERTMFTQFGQLIGTFEYMSPEQARLNQLDVDTRSDIYSLGVLLYELLAGSTPLEKERVRSAAFDEILRIISEEEPPKPSTRLGSSQTLPSIATNRHTEPAKLSDDIRAELDWIVMKCLEKNRDRRYETASGLAHDIQRYLNDEPVLACPPSTRYRIAKFASRNKSLLVAGAAISAALILGLGLTTWQYFRATSESARATAVSSLLQEMLGSADAGRAKGSDYTVRELLSDFSEHLGDQLAGQPEAEAEIHATIARAFRSLRLPQQAQPHFEKAIQLRRQADGSQHENVAAILVDYAWNLRDQQRYSDAETQLRTALEIYDRRGVTGGPVFYALAILQHVLISSDRYVEAERVTHQALAIGSRGPEDSFDKASLLHRFAGMRNSQGRFADAEKLAREAVEMHRQLRGNQHPETAWALSTLGRALQEQQKLSDAEAAYRESLAIFRHCYGESHGLTSGVIDNLISIARARHDTDAANALAIEQAELVASRSDGPANRLRLANLLMSEASKKDARKEMARRLIRSAMEDYGQIANDTPPDEKRGFELVDEYLAVARLCLKDPDFAPELDEAYRRRTEELERLLAAFPDSVSLYNDAAYRYRAWAFLVEGNSHCVPQYEDALRRSIELFEKVSLKDPSLLRLWFFLASSCVYFGDITWVSAKSEDAEAAFKRAMEIYEQHRAEIENESESNYIWEIVRLYSCIAYYLSATDRTQQAADYVGRASVNAKRLADPSDLADSLYYVAILQARLGDTAGYRATCESLVDLPISKVEGTSKLRPIWTPCLAPGALKDPNVPLRLAEEFVASNPLNEPRYGTYLLGAAHYRAGQFKAAAEQLEQSIDALPNGPPLVTHSINYLRLLLAMSKWQLGEKNAARRLLSETLPEVENEVQRPSSLWNRRAILELLRDEAEALIAPTEANEAVEIETRPDNKSSPNSVGQSPEEMTAR